MRQLRAFAATLALGATLAACSQGSGALGAIDVDPKSIEAHVTRLAGETLKGKMTAAADLEAVRALLPPEVALSWGNLTFDAASNSTLVTGVKLTPKDNPAVGVQIAELRLWDLDTKLLQDRISGQRLAETAPLARRIDAKGVSLFGMASLMNTLGGLDETIAVEPTDPVAADPTAPPTDDAQPGWPDTTEPSMDFDQEFFRTTFNKYDFSFGRIILDDVVLRPYEVHAAVPADANAWGMTGANAAMFQQYMSALRAYGVDTFAATDMKGEMSMTQLGQTVTASFSTKSMGTRGMRGGDMDASYMTGLKYLIDMTESPMLQTPAINMEYAVDYMSMEDMRFDKLYGFIAKGVAPPRTETDIMSLGAFKMEKQSVKVSGVDVMTVAEANFDARKFHWLIPTEMTANAKGAVINFGGIMQMAAAYQAANPPPPPPEPAPGVDPDSDAEMDEFESEFGMVEAPPPDFAAIAAALERNGLSKPNLNFNFGWNWNAASGDTKVDLGMGGEKLMQVDFKYEGGFPAFKAVSDLIPETNPESLDPAALEKVFNEKSVLKLVDINIADNGGLQKMFDLTADMSQVMASTDPSGFNPMQGQTGASLRQMAGAMVMMVGASPDIAPFVSPLAAFINEGGKLRLSLKPPQPMPMSGLVERLSAPPAGSTPGQVLKDLGLKVEHSK